MNYVEQTEADLNRRNWIDPANIPVPAGGPVRLTEVTPAALGLLTEAMKRQIQISWPYATHLYASQASVDLTFAGHEEPKIKFKPVEFRYVPAVDYQALAAFRADVIEELQREITALKLDRDAKMDAARGLRDTVREKAPTKGEVLANALARCDSITTAYGR